MVEGAKVLSEAVQAGAKVESVYLDPLGAGAAEQTVAARCLDAGARVFDLDSGVLERVAATVNPQPVIAIIADVSVGWRELAGRGLDLAVVCAGLRDPGNAGTVLRSAAAAGAGAVFACDGSVDMLNPKTVRASAGAVFHVPLAVGGEIGEVLASLGGSGLHRWGTVARGGDDYVYADLTRRSAVVVGNEASGLSPTVSSQLDGLLSIPMASGTESLNVGIAAAVICFEAARQRRLGEPVRRAGDHPGSAASLSKGERAATGTD